MTVACSVCRYANHLSFPSFCPVLCMLRFPTASEGNASISRGYRTEGDRAAPWSVHSSPQRIKAAQALIVSGFGHWKGSLKTSLRPPGAPARPVGRSARWRQELVLISGLSSLCTRHTAGAERTNPTCYCLPPVRVCVSGQMQPRVAARTTGDVFCMFY